MVLELIDNLAQLICFIITLFITLWCMIYMWQANNYINVTLDYFFFCPRVSHRNLSRSAATNLRSRSVIPSSSYCFAKTNCEVVLTWWNISLTRPYKGTWSVPPLNKAPFIQGHLQHSRFYSRPFIPGPFDMGIPFDHIVNLSSQLVLGAMWCTFEVCIKWTLLVKLECSKELNDKCCRKVV